MIRALSVNVSGHFCNTWPNLQITHNDNVIYDGDVIENQLFDFDLESKDVNILTISLTNKSLGVNNIWDTQVNDANEIISDKFIKINNVMLSGVDITGLIYNSAYTVNASNDILTTHHGLLNFNGAIEFCFNEPLLNFLINAKYKKEIDTTKSYFSNNTYLFHYDMETQLIGEIRKLLSNKHD